MPEGVSARALHGPQHRDGRSLWRGIGLLRQIGGHFDGPLKDNPSKHDFRLREMAAYFRECEVNDRLRHGGIESSETQDQRENASLEARAVFLRLEKHWLTLALELDGCHLIRTGYLVLCVSRRGFRLDGVLR